jgi:sulfur carrier protein
VNVLLNGEPRNLPERATVARAVEATAADAGARGLAVAVDGDVVPRGSWETTTLTDGQRVEVVQAVQGG